MASLNKKKFNWNIELGGIGPKDILFFTRHLALALDNGLTLKEGLEMLVDQTEKGRFKKVLGEILEAIQAGQTFHTALEKYPKVFPSIYINLIKTGELSGTLEGSLKHLSEELKKSAELKSKIKSAMTYPILILVAVLGLGVSVSLFVLPNILPLFKTLDIELPASTRGLIFMTDLFAEQGLWILLSLVVFLFLTILLLTRSFMKLPLHRFLLHLPVIGSIIANIQVERFTRILNTLLKSGATLDKSLLITADATNNQVYKKAIQALANEIKKGNSLSTGMENYPKLFPKITARMIGMGEKTGGLENTLTHLNAMLADEIDNTLKNLSTIIEPFMLIMIGVFVGLVAISILGPIYEITGSLR